MRTITYDVQVPTATVTLPVNFMNSSQSTIEGTAEDAPAGIAFVEIAISSDSTGNPGAWWDGADFTANLGDPGTYRSTNTYTLGSPDSWTYNRPALTQGVEYLVVLRTTDKAGNVRTQTIGEGITFVYDETGPTATIVDPNEDYEKSLPILSGGSSDPTTSITNVEVAISTGIAAPYTAQVWNGSSWQAGPSLVWINATAENPPFNTNNENWFLDHSTPTWINDVVYKIHVRAKDAADNTGTVNTSTFTFDDTPATAGVVIPAGDSAHRALTLVTGTMSDFPNPTPTIVQIALRNPAHNFWNGSDFVGYHSVNSWLPATQVFDSTWTFTNLPSTWDDRTIYRLYARAIDAAGNPVQDPPVWATAGRPFTIDYSSPTSSVDSLSTTATSYINVSLTVVSGTADEEAGG
ncbi:hypothetical protein BVX98_02980, partial [bacterium F11]